MSTKTQAEIKSYLILKYGSMSNAIDFYVSGRQTGTSPDYELMHEYFHQMSKRVYGTNSKG